MLFNQNQYQQSPSQATNASQASNLAKPTNNYMNQNNLGQFLLKKGSSGTSLLHAIDIHNRKPTYAAQGQMFLPNQKPEGRQPNVNKIGSEQSNTQNHQDNDKYENEKQMGSNEQSNYFGSQHSHTLQKGKSPYPTNNLFKEVIIEDENEENIRNPSN